MIAVATGALCILSNPKNLFVLWVCEVTAASRDLDASTRSSSGSGSRREQ